MNAITGEVKLPVVSRKYVTGLIVTTGAVLLLPILYFAVMALLFGVAFVLIQKGYAWLACLPVVVILGLMKPFLAKASAVKRPRTLRRDAEPFLFAYVDRLCDSIGARSPTSIHISCDMNAAAEFRNGWFVIFGNRAISLHLGLPMVAGLTLRQFTGVLSHELGHFTQRTAMWLENIVRRTNHWLYRAAYERDSVDDWLALRCSTGGLGVVVCYFARGVVWVTRWVWLGLALAGTAISGLMSREMEFNADRCELRTVGLPTFRSTLWRMRQLSVAHQISFRDVAAFYDEGRLPDNMIALAEANTAFITPKVKKALRRMMVEEKTGVFDTHPSDRDRIRAVEADGSLGSFTFDSLRNDLPATVLFSRFEEICKVATTEFYESLLNRKIKSQLLHPVGKLLERQMARMEAAKALGRYFQSEIPPLRPLPIAPQSIDSPEDPRETAKELRSCRQKMMDELPAYKRLLPRYRMAEDTYFEAVAAQALIQARLSFSPADFHLAEASSEVVADKLARAREGVAHLAGKLLPFETEAGNRLSFAMQLLHVPSVVQKMDHGDDLQFEVQELLPEAQFISRLIGELPTLRVVFYRLLALSERIRGGRSDEKPVAMILEQMASICRRLVTIQNEMADRLYPFDHAQADTTLRAYALPHIPNEQDLPGIIEATEHLQSRLVTIQIRLFARLAQTAEKIEAAIGMPPLPEPDDPSEGSPEG